MHRVLYALFGQCDVVIGGLHIWLRPDFLHVFWQTDRTINRWLLRHGYDRQAARKALGL